MPRMTEGGLPEWVKSERVRWSATAIVFIGIFLYGLSQRAWFVRSIVAGEVGDAGVRRLVRTGKEEAAK